LSALIIDLLVSLLNSSVFQIFFSFSTTFFSSFTSSFFSSFTSSCFSAFFSSFTSSFLVSSFTSSFLVSFFTTLLCFSALIFVFLSETYVATVFFFSCFIISSAVLSL